MDSLRVRLLLQAAGKMLCPGVDVPTAAWGDRAGFCTAALPEAGLPCPRRVCLESVPALPPVASCPSLACFVALGRFTSTNLHFLFFTADPGIALVNVPGWLCRLDPFGCTERGISCVNAFSSIHTQWLTIKWNDCNSTLQRKATLSVSKSCYS